MAGVLGIFCSSLPTFLRLREYFVKIVWHLFFQNMNASGFRACVKELYETRYEPVSVSYAVLTGQKTLHNGCNIKYYLSWGGLLVFEDPNL